MILTGASVGIFDIHLYLFISFYLHVYLILLYIYTLSLVHPLLYSSSSSTSFVL